ncbi:MAG: hypothetical protein NVSMB29_05360 [Candidatus Dormibacteria bacterium]
MTVHESIRAHFTALESGDVALAATVVAPSHINERAADEPPACGAPGPAGFIATAAWLRFAFPDIHFTVLGAVVEGDLAVAHVRMQGHQTGAFVVFDSPGHPQVFPPTRRALDVEQCHLFRLAGDQSTGHTAVRDDLGMMRQLGHIPPSPRRLVAMAWWKLSGRAARTVREVTAATERAAESARSEIDLGVAV